MRSCKTRLYCYVVPISRDLLSDLASEKLIPAAMAYCSHCWPAFYDSTF